MKFNKTIAIVLIVTLVLILLVYWSSLRMMESLDENMKGMGELFLSVSIKLIFKIEQS